LKRFYALIARLIQAREKTGGIMKTRTGWLTVLAVVLTAFVLIPFLYAQDDEDFISVSPVEKKDTGEMMKGDVVQQGAVEKPAAAPAVAAPAVKEAPAKRASIDKILALDLADKTEIRIITSSRVKYKATELSAPPNPRILVQVNDCSVDGKTIAYGKSGVDKIRSAPHNSTAWVVVDMSQQQRWKVRDEGEVIIVEIPKGGKSQASASAVAPRPAPASMLYRIIDIAGKNLDKKTRIIVTSDGQVKYRVKKDAAHKMLTLNIVDAVSIWKKGSLTLDSGSVSGVTVKEDRAARVVDVNVALNENMAYTVTRDENQIIIDVDNAAGTGKKLKRRLDLYQKISLNIQDAGLPGLLRLLSTQTGFEFSVSPMVSASTPVTIREDDQTLDQILRDILIPQGLFYEVEGNIIKVGSIDELKKAKSLKTKLTKFYYPKTMTSADLKTLLGVRLDKEPIMDVAVQADTTAGANRVMIVGTADDVDKVMDIISNVDYTKGADYSDSGDEATDGDYYQIKVYKLNNIRLQTDIGSGQLGTGNYSTFEERVIGELKNAFGNIKTDKGSIDFDRRTSSIIVNDIAKVQRKMAKLIKALDVKVPQISIEAKIYEISTTATKDLGITWSNQTQGNEPFIKQDVQTGQNGGITSLAPGIAGSVLKLGFIQSGINFTAYLNALETQNKATLLSAPKVTVDVNQPAHISTTRVVYYEVQSVVATASGTNIATSYNSLQVPLTLVVYCKDTKEDTINMLIHLDVSQIVNTGRTAGPPDTTEQIADTSVKAKNNETIVIGGLVSDQVSDTETKVPLLGDLPLIGGLFKGTDKSVNKVELVMFLTPSIVEE
jgi:type II secretory pathway component GspD/PulD (secretin)